MSAPVFGTCSPKAQPPSAPFSLFSLGLLDPRAKASGPSEQPTGSASGHAEQPTSSASGPAEPAGGGSGALGHVDVSTQTNLDASTQHPEPAGDGAGAETEARELLTTWDIICGGRINASRSSEPADGGSGGEKEAAPTATPVADASMETPPEPQQVPPSVLGGLAPAREALTSISEEEHVGEHGQGCS